MQRPQCIVPVAVAVFAGLLATPLMAAAPPEGIGYVARLMNRHVHGRCSATLAPDAALVSLAVTGEGARPGDARGQVTEKIAKVQSIANRHGGRVQRSELVRMMGSEASGRNVPPAESPPRFLFLQQIELSFPLRADLDAVLEQLVEAGIDRLGKQHPVHYRGNQLKTVVRYVFSDAQSRLDGILRECRAQALARWCESSAPAEARKECAAELARYDERIVTQSLYLRSQSVTREQGGHTPVQINYPWQPHQLDQLELSSNTALRLEGTINLSLPATAW